MDLSKVQTHLRSVASFRAPLSVGYDRCSRPVTRSIGRLVRLVCVFMRLLSGPREWSRSLVVHAQLNYNFRQAITQQLAEKHGLIVSRHDLNAQWWSSIGLNGQCTNKYGNVLARWAREDRMAAGTVLHL